jgi:signal peptide peptidase SppA
MELLNFKFWSGSEDSLHAYLTSIKQMVEAGVTEPPKRAGYWNQDEEDEMVPRLFSQQGDIGVISIAGPLNNTDSWKNEYIGATGYPEIRAALVHAAQQADVKAIVLDIKSGGGAVSGVTDTAELVAMVDQKVKPVYAFSDGMIASAAYWLGSSARSVDIGKVTEAGSIGVLTVHQDLSKLFADMGVKMTVLRAGEYKALGNSYEPLSDKARAEIQGQLDQMYTVFVQHVADSRGVSYAVADEKMAQGRVFVGQAAVDAGLVDSVTSFDALLSKIQGGIDAEKSSPKYGASFSKGTFVKSALTEQQIAALASGSGSGTDEESKAAADKAAADKAAAEQAAQAEAEAKEKAEADAAEAGSSVALKAQVDLLQAQLGQAQGQLLDVQVRLRDAEAALAPVQASIEKMRPVVRQSVANLRVAMGGTAAGVEALNDEALLAEQSSLAEQFQSKFKAGGVAAVPQGEPTEKAGEVGGDSAHLARIRATRPNR